MYYVNQSKTLSKKAWLIYIVLQAFIFSNIENVGVKMKNIILTIFYF